MDKALRDALPKRRCYTLIEAVFSYQLDLDCGKVRGFREYSRIWGWSTTKVVNFIKNTQGTRTEEPKNTHATVKFRFIKPLEESKGHAKDTQGTKKKRAGDTTIIPDPLNPYNPKKERLFEEFWEVYPLRDGKKMEKGETQERFSSLNEDNMSLCINAAKNYADSKRVQEGIGIRDPKRFIYVWHKGKKIEFWREWLEPETTKREGVFSLKDNKTGGNADGDEKQGKYSGLGIVVKSST